MGHVLSAAVRLRKALGREPANRPKMRGDSFQQISKPFLRDVLTRLGSLQELQLH
jgi:hypothetical protein